MTTTLETNLLFIQYLIQSGQFIVLALSPELKIRCEQTILEFLKSDSDKLNIPLDHEHILECFRLLKERAYKNETSTSRDNEIIELRKTLEQRNQEISKNY